MKIITQNKNKTIRCFAKSIRKFKNHSFGLLFLLASLGFCLFLILVWLEASGIQAHAQTTLEFANPTFQNVWQYSDKPVSELQNVGRGFTWGPTSLGITTENYIGAPGGKRLVQYFDKSRMELSADGKNITNGLLTQELVTGKRQDGDNSFTQLAPCQIQVVGDDNTNGQNQISPVYASFKDVISNQPGQNKASNRVGQSVDATINRAGGVSTLKGDKTTIQPIKISYYDPTFGHNIPQPFFDYERLQGQVWQNPSGFGQGQIYTTNPTANVFGYPISEAFWTKAVVGGQVRDVLVQLFERRVLTYTPSNPDPFKVEMGNIGRHYLRWRYNEGPLTSANNSQRVIVLDPGHGGADSGAVHTDANNNIDLMEKTVTLQISLKTSEYLQKDGYKVLLTRKTDESPNTPPVDLNNDGVLDVYDDLLSRIKFANDNQAQVFLSIHINSTDEKNVAGGIETIYCADRPFTDKSKSLAQLIQKESLATLKDLTGYAAQDRQVTDDLQIDNTGKHLYVLGPTNSKQMIATSMPGALTEALFISNDTEVKLLTDPKTINALASAYAKAIEEYFS